MALKRHYSLIAAITLIPLLLTGCSTVKGFWCNITACHREQNIDLERRMPENQPYQGHSH